jgi:hypothetical protein
MLRKEYQFYLDNRSTLLKKHSDKYIVIKGKKFIASYDTYDIANEESLKGFLAGTFLIQLCTTNPAPLRL